LIDPKFNGLFPFRGQKNFYDNLAALKKRLLLLLLLSFGVFVYKRTDKHTKTNALSHPWRW